MGHLIAWNCLPFYRSLTKRRRNTPFSEEAFKCWTKRKKKLLHFISLNPESPKCRQINWRLLAKLTRMNFSKGNENEVMFFSEELAKRSDPGGRLPRPFIFIYIYIFICSLLFWPSPSGGSPLENCWTFESNLFFFSLNSYVTFASSLLLLSLSGQSK